MLNTIRIAIRQHLRRPGFALTVVLTVGVTGGATTVVFAVVNGMLIRALPFAAPDKVVWIASVRSDSPSAPFSLPEFMDYRAQTRTLSGMAAYANWSASIAGDGLTERFQGARLSANTFEVLGVSPAAGRLLTESDDRPDATKVVVISYRLWQRQYGGAADLVGRTVRINTEPFVIVGVTPADFELPLRGIDVMTPLVPERDPLRHVRNSANFLRVFGRLAPDADARQAERELTTICRSLRQQFPKEYARKDAVRVVAFHEAIVGDYRPSMVLLFGAVVVVLAAALANLVSLALVRANERRAELSMRVALGASRWQLTRQLATEACLLAVTGTGLGWLLAQHTRPIAIRFAPPSVPRLGEVHFDGTVLILATVLTMIVAALLTVASLSVGRRTQGAPASHSGNRGTVGDRWNHRVRQLMVVSEIAAALVLLLATLVLVQNLHALRDVHPGFVTEGVFQARVSIPPTYDSPQDLARFHDRLSEHLRSAPGVEHLGTISVAPLSGLLRAVPFSVADQHPADRNRPIANLRAVSEGYFATVRTRVIQGRSFSDDDRWDTPHVAVVSAALADRFFGGNAVGQRLRINDNNTGPRPVDIVGTVENVRHAALDLPPAFDIYLPLRQSHRDEVGFLRSSQFWMVRTGSDPESFRQTFLTHVRAVDPDAAVSDAGTMGQFVDGWLGPRRFNLGVFGAFAITAILIAVVGLYGLVSYSVSQRTPEIGLRMAIGASPGAVLRMILGEAVALGVAGTVAGLGVAAALRPFLGGLAQEIWVHPAGVAVAATLLFITIVTAAWLPASRATQIDPTIAIRG